MDNSFFLYLDRLVLMGFFSGYPLIYYIIRLIGENSRIKKMTKTNISALLPYSYALVGVLYFGLFLKNLYPDYSFVHIESAFADPFLKIWGLLSILFFIPALNKKPGLSLLHSLVFFFFLVKDLLLNFVSSTAKDTVQNDMAIYTSSLLLNAVTFIAILLLFFITSVIKKANGAK